MRGRTNHSMATIVPRGFVEIDRPYSDRVHEMLSIAIDKLTFVAATSRLRSNLSVIRLHRHGVFVVSAKTRIGY